MNEPVVTVYFPLNQGLAQVRYWARKHEKELNHKTAKILKNRTTGQLALLYADQAPIIV